MRDRSIGRRAAASAFTMVLLCALAHTIGAATPAAAATTIHVPADQPTIAAAMAAATNGDTIEVAPGTYTEDVSFGGKDVDLVAPTGATIAAVTGPAVRIGSGGSIAGFRIDGGASALGAGAIYVEGDGAEIRGNTITGFTPTQLIGFQSTYAITIDRNLITDNTCDGQLIFVAAGGMHFTNNQVVDNHCGATVRVNTGPGPVIANNTIVGNDAGFSIAGLATDTVAIRNNLVTDNGAGVVMSLGGGVPIGFTNNLVAGNGTNYPGVDATGSNGNVGGPVGVIDLLGRDLRLTATSAAVDAGSATDAPADDFDGSARPLDGPDADAEPEFDIGAFERDGTEPPPVPQTGTIDTTWSGDGISLQSSRYNIALGPYGDGATYVGSYKQTDGNGPMRITKLTSTDAPAPGWGSSGYVLRAFEPGGKGLSFPTQVVPVGIRITVVGEHYRDTARLGVARLRSDGSYDTSFSGDGRQLYKVFQAEHDVVSAFRAEVLTGGKIGISVLAFDADSHGDLHFTGQAMLRLNSNGTADTTFSGDGVAVVPNNWSDIRWLPNGASFVGVQGSTSHQVRKLLPSGQLDKTFSGDGIVTAACGSHIGANLGIDLSKRPLLMCLKLSGSSTVLAIYRFTTTGAFDTTYSGDGKTSWVIPESNWTTPGSSSMVRVSFDQLGKPWAAAAGPGATKDLRIYTLDAAGNPDTAFNEDGAATITLPWNVFLGDTWRSGNRLFVTNLVGTVNMAIIGIQI